MKLKKIHVATKHLKSAWINDEDQVIAFREIDSARNYSATEGDFWNYIMELVMIGYRIG
jgi:hypothetical protein